MQRNAAREIWQDSSENPISECYITPRLADLSRPCWTH
jgi:hypothetical protein